MIIGGAEDKVRKPTILKHFVALSGGRDARIAVELDSGVLEERGVLLVAGQ